MMDVEHVSKVCDTGGRVDKRHASKSYSLKPATGRDTFAQPSPEKFHDFLRRTTTLIRP